MTSKTERECLETIHNFMYLSITISNTPVLEEIKDVLACLIAVHGWHAFIDVEKPDRKEILVTEPIRGPVTCYSQCERETFHIWCGRIMNTPKFSIKFKSYGWCDDQEVFKDRMEKYLENK